MPTVNNQKKIPIIKALKWLKYLRVKQTTEMQNIQSENYEILLKEIKDLN